MNAIYTNTLQFLEQKFSGSMKETKVSRENLTASYKGQQKRKAGFKDDGERFAYLLSRFPATYHACLSVFQKLPELGINSVLDLGAGPGTASLAAYSLFPTLCKVTCVEQDMEMASIGQEIAVHNGLSSSFHNENLNTWNNGEKADLVVLSYVLGELHDNTQSKVLQKAWDVTEKALVIISPGTSHLFPDFLKWRQQLLDLGAHLLAPCPQNSTCPMMGTKDWCHFKVRVARTKAMRYLKSGTESYEDEPYSYLIFTREKYEPASARIITEPQKKGGHVNLMLCTDGKLEKKTIAKSHTDYKKITKLSAGAEFKE